MSGSSVETEQSTMKNGLSDNDSEHCTTVSCVDDRDPKKLSCTRCKRYVHYKCSRIPAYVLQVLLDKNYRHFVCINCMDISKEIADIMDESISLNESKEMEELSKKLKRVSFESEHQQREHNIKAKNYLLKLEQYKNDISELEKREVRLKSAIQTLEKKYSEVKQQINSEHSIVDKVENAVATKLEMIGNNLIKTIGENLKKSFAREAKKNNESVESKLQQVVEVVEESKTYAKAAKSNLPVSEWSVPSDKKEIQTFVQEVENVKLMETRDRKQRTCNIILHGVKEESEETTNENDKEFITKLLSTVHKSDIIKTHARLGLRCNDRKRPIKVVLTSESDKKSVMSNLFKLKGKEEFNGISIKPDYTLAERDQLRKYSEKAKLLNAEEPADSENIWRIVGTPKNGLAVRKFRKRATIALPTDS